MWRLPKVTDSIPVLKYGKKVNLFTRFGSVLNRFGSVMESVLYLFYRFGKETSALWDGLNQFHKNHTLHSHFKINPGWPHENDIHYESIHIGDYFGNTYS